MVEQVRSHVCFIAIKQLLAFFLGYNLETGFNRGFLALGGIKLAILYYKHLSKNQMLK